MRFAYQQYHMKSPAMPGVIINRPEISVKVIGLAGVVTLDAVVDTGSDLTLIPRWVAGQIGATVDDTRRWPLAGLAGHVIEASPGDVELEISSKGSFFRWTTAVVFVNYPAGSKVTTILGHSGFLDFFRATFDGSARELEIEVTPAFNGILG
jgi:hypothetical protein